MSAQDDALYQRAQQLYDSGDQQGAAAIASQLRARGYVPPTQAPTAATPAPAATAPAASPAAPAATPAPAAPPARRAAATPAPAQPSYPAEIQAGGPEAQREFDAARRFRAAGNRGQADLALARAVGYANAARILSHRQATGGGRVEAGLLSFVPEGVSNFIGRLTRPAGMSEAQFNEYSRVFHEAFATRHPLSSVAGSLSQAAVVPSLGAEGIVARAGGGFIPRVAARVAENATVGAGLETLNTDDASRAGEGAIFGAAGGEAARVVGHGISFAWRRAFPGRSTAAYRSIVRSLDDAQITPQEFNAIEQRYIQNTGQRPSPLQVLRDPALGERGQRALVAIQNIARGNAGAAARMQITEAETARAAAQRRANNPHPHTSAQSDVNFGAIADNPVDADEASRLLQHTDIGPFVRPKTGEVGMVRSQTERFQLADDVRRAREALATIQGLHAQGQTVAPQAMQAAQSAVTRAEAAYAANPVTVNDVEALRQIVDRGVQSTGNRRIAEGLRTELTRVGDNASNGQFSQNIATHAASASAEEEALSRGVEATREATPGAAWEDQGGTASHAAAAAGHAARGGVVASAYHATAAARGASRGVNAREAQQLAEAATTPGGTNAFAGRLQRAREEQFAQRPTVVSTVGTAGSRVGPVTSRPQGNAQQQPSDADLYRHAQELYDQGDREGAKAIVDDLKARGFTPEQDTATPTSFNTGGGQPSSLERMVQAREGFRASVYNDAGGHPTIGYGHLIKAGEDFSNGITEAQAQALLRRDIEENTAGPLANLNRGLTDQQREALVSFGFNAGPGALQRAVDAINRTGNFAEASRIIMRYVTSNGKRVPGLVARRRLEVAALQNGEG